MTRLAMIIEKKQVTYAAVARRAHLQPRTIRLIATHRLAADGRSRLSLRADARIPGRAAAPADPLLHLARARPSRACRIPGRPASRRRPSARDEDRPPPGCPDNRRRILAHHRGEVEVAAGPSSLPVGGGSAVCPGLRGQTSSQPRIIVGGDPVATASCVLLPIPGPVAATPRASRRGSSPNHPPTTPGSGRRWQQGRDATIGGARDLHVQLPRAGTCAHSPRTYQQPAEAGRRPPRPARRSSLFQPPGMPRTPGPPGAFGTRGWTTRSISLIGVRSTIGGSGSMIVIDLW